MTLAQTMDELQAMGTEQNRKIYPRHGIKEPMFGVSHANLNALKKKNKCDHGLALELWETGNHDARLLATKIADPQAVTDQQAEVWVRELDNYVLTEGLVALMAQTPLARQKMEAWVGSDQEFIADAGWSLLASLVSDKNLPDRFFEPYLKTIQSDIHHRPNRVRHAMNGALISIGTRSSGLEAKALAVAKKTGKVQVDHGQTGCKTPDAADYIRKVVEHRAARAAKA